MRERRWAPWRTDRSMSCSTNGLRSSPTQWRPSTSCNAGRKLAADISIKAHSPPVRRPRLTKSPKSTRCAPSWASQKFRTSTSNPVMCPFHTLTAPTAPLVQARLVLVSPRQAGERTQTFRMMKTADIDRAGGVDFLASNLENHAVVDGGALSCHLINSRANAPCRRSPSRRRDRLPRKPVGCKPRCGSQPLRMPPKTWPRRSWERTGPFIGLCP